jgi:hypothetical protein
MTTPESVLPGKTEMILPEEFQVFDKEIEATSITTTVARIHDSYNLVKYFHYEKATLYSGQWSAHVCHPDCTEQCPPF